LASWIIRHALAGGWCVKDIGDYGNCMGVPTVAGDVVFDDAYAGNPLVNAMCVGVMREEELIRAVASGVGNPIIAVGARTGRDGIHGASFASEDLSHENDAKRPRVQVGDPFTEKLLLEASLELIRSGHIVAIQDMGAAGLTSSSAEMAARGDVGVEIDVTRMPLREEGMTPYEILLSESQERMLVVALKGREAQVKAILAKWDLSAEVIGEVIAEPVYRVKEGDRVVAEFPGSRLVTDCPVYHPEARESDAIRALRETDVDAIAERPEEANPMWTLERLLASPTIASKSWIVRQYDSTVRASTCWPGRRCRGRARARDRARPRAQDRLQPALRLPRPAHGWPDRRRRSGAQRRLRRGPPHCDNQLPQLREPPEAGSVLPVPRGGGGHGRSLSGVRHAGDRRKRLLLQRKPVGRGVSDTHDRHGWAARRRRTRHDRRLQDDR
jgi:hypothetical protein